MQMARTSLLKQRALSWKIMIAVFTFFVLGYCLSYIALDIYGVNIYSAPKHDSPKSCEKEGFQVCTTSVGTCTNISSKCALPTRTQDCKFVKHISSWNQQQYFQDHPDMKKTKMSPNEIDLIRQRYQQYCGSPLLALHLQLSLEISPMLVLVQICMTAVIFIVLYPEIKMVTEIIG